MRLVQTLCKRQPHRVVSIVVFGTDEGGAVMMWRQNLELTKRMFERMQMRYSWKLQTQGLQVKKQARVQRRFTLLLVLQRANFSRIQSRTQTI